nr:MAG TPA: hypothetical protein [Caudoviricetes sp.]
MIKRKGKIALVLLYFLLLELFLRLLFRFSCLFWSIFKLSVLLLELFLIFLSKCSYEFLLFYLRFSSINLSLLFITKRYSIC